LREFVTPMIGALSGSSQGSSAAQSNSAKEAALQSQIDTTDAKANTVGCADTSAKLKKQVAKLKAQLAALQASDGASGKSGATKKGETSQKLAGPEATARQAEFDNDDVHDVASAQSTVM
jgi:hypothetical protein